MKLKNKVGLICELIKIKCVWKMNELLAKLNVEEACKDKNMIEKKSNRKRKWDTFTNGMFEMCYRKKGEM